jgi:hypothetical protein
MNESPSLLGRRTKVLEIVTQLRKPKSQSSDFFADEALLSGCMIETQSNH